MNDFSVACNAVWRHFAHSRISFKIGIIPFKPCHNFMWYSQPFVISTILTVSSLEIDSISRIHFAHVQEATPPHLWKFYPEVTAIQWHLQAPLLILVFLLWQLFPPLRSWTPQSHPWRLESTSSNSSECWHFNSPPWIMNVLNGI